MAPLFLLPNIKILNLTRMGYHAEGDEVDLDFFLPAHCSSVEELAFSGCCLLHAEIEKLTKACKCLRRLTCLSSCSDFGNLTNMLSEEYGHCLENLFLDEYYETIDTPNLREFRKLKSVDCISMSTLLVKGEAGDDLSAMQTDEHNAGHVHMIDMRNILPIGIESITIRLGRWWPLNVAALGDHIHKELLRAVADLVEDDRFAQLKVVCVWYMAVRSRLSTNQPFHCHTEALERIQAKGVDLHCIGRYWAGMTVEEHIRLHPDPNDRVTELETDPRRPEDS